MSSTSIPKTYVGVGPYYVRTGLVDSTRVVNLPLPTNEDDAISLRALRSYTDAYKITKLIQLTGTDYTDLQNDAVDGTLYVTIMPDTIDASVGGPVGSWRFSRAASTSIFTETTCRASDLETTLEVDWPKGATPRVRKTTANYDGTYLVSVQP